jgi:hypothetical protein
MMKTWTDLIGDWDDFISDLNVDYWSCARKPHGYCLRGTARCRVVFFHTSCDFNDRFAF